MDGAGGSGMITVTQANAATIAYLSGGIDAALQCARSGRDQGLAVTLANPPVLIRDLLADLWLAPFLKIAGQ